MALSESALSELRAAIDVGHGGDLIRQLAEWGLQQLIEAEATGTIGAARYERSHARVTERNGHRPRVLSTKAGDLALRIPKLREGAFFASILEPRRRIDQALYAVVGEHTAAVRDRQRGSLRGPRPPHDDARRATDLEVEMVASPSSLPQSDARQSLRFTH